MAQINNILESKSFERWLVLLITVVGLLLINIISSRYFFRVDLTEDQRFSITEATKDLLSDIDDVVYVEVSETGLGNLKCSGLRDGTDTKGFTTLFNNQREIRCSQTINNPGDFEKVINIAITYDYEQFISTTLNVKHAS